MAPQLLGVLERAQLGQRRAGGVGGFRAGAAQLCALFRNAFIYRDGTALLRRHIGGKQPRQHFRTMEMVSIEAGRFSEPLDAGFAGKSGGSLLLDSAGGAGVDRERYADVLEGHHSMGAVIDAVWAARGLYFQLAPFFAATEPGLLGAPGFVSEPGGLLAQS